MKQLLTSIKLSFISLFLVLLISSPVMAYVGPGSGLTAIGAFLALVAGVLVAIFGFLWYPIKRLWRKRKKSRENNKNNRREEE